MRKTVHLDEKAVKELGEFSKEIQRDFKAVFEILEKKGRLEFPEAKKIAENLFEIRVYREGAYRGFYAYIGKKYIVVLHFFPKKTQKTPLKHIRVAKRRLKSYE